MRKLFSADGIRGEVDVSPLDRESILRIAGAVGLYVREKWREPVCLIGCDTRESSQRLKSIFVDGLNRSGIGTVDVDVLPTSAISYLMARKGVFSAGLVFSASHNPITENGIKIFNESGLKLADDEEAKIEDYFADIAQLPRVSRYAFNIKDPDYARQYTRQLVREFRDYRWNNLNVMLDAANGASYIVAPDILRNLGCKISLINASPDGTNINQNAGSEFARYNPDKIEELLLRSHKTVSISLDGDADRVVLVDKYQNYYDGDSLLAILGLRYKNQEKLSKNELVTTTMSNPALKEYFAENRITLQIVSNGDKYITSALLDNGLVLGGEQIGHLVIHNQPEWLTGDGLRTALTVLSELAENPDMSIIDMMPNLKRYPQVLVSVHLDTRTNIAKDEITGLSDLISKLEFEYPDVRVSHCRPATTESSYRLLLESRVTPVATLMAMAKRLATCIYRHIPTKAEAIYALDCAKGGMRTL